MRSGRWLGLLGWVVIQIACRMISWWRRWRCWVSWWRRLSAMICSGCWITIRTAGLGWQIGARSLSRKAIPSCSKWRVGQSSYIYITFSEDSEEQDDSERCVCEDGHQRRGAAIELTWVERGHPDVRAWLLWLSRIQYRQVLASGWGNSFFGLIGSAAGVRRQWRCWCRHLGCN